MWDPWNVKMGFGLRFCSHCSEFVRTDQWIPWPEQKPSSFHCSLLHSLDLIRGGFSSTWSRAPCSHCPLHQRLFGSTLGIGKFMRHLTILTHILGYLTKQYALPKKLTPSQSKKKKKRKKKEKEKTALIWNTEKKHYPNKKLLKETRLLPPLPLFPLGGPKFGWI